MANNIERKVKRLILAAGFGIVGLTAEESKAREAQEELKGMNSRDKQSEESKTSTNSNEIKHAGKDLTLTFGRDIPEVYQGEPEVAQQIEPTPIPTQVAELFSNLEIDGIDFTLNTMEELDENTKAQMRNILGEATQLFEVVLPANFANLKMGIRSVDGVFYVYDKTSENPYYTLVNLNSPEGRDQLLRALGAEIILPERIPAQISVKGQVNIRESANPNGTFITSVSEGTLEVVDSEVLTSGGFSWYHVKTSNGQIGWVADAGRIEVPNNLDGTVTVYTITFPENAYIPTAEELERQARLAELGVDPESGLLSLYGDIERLPEKAMVLEQIPKLDIYSTSPNLRPSVTSEIFDSNNSRTILYSFSGAYFVDSELFRADEDSVMRIHYVFRFTNGKSLNVYLDSPIAVMVSKENGGVEVKRIDALKANPHKVDPDLALRFNVSKISYNDKSDQAMEDICENSIYRLNTCLDIVEVIKQTEHMQTDLDFVLRIIEANGNMEFDQSKKYFMGQQGQLLTQP